MTKEIQTNKEIYYKQVLMILNFNLNLTEYEIDIMSLLLKENKVIDTQLRKDIMLKLKKSSFTFNNYIKRLKDKGLLIKDKGELKVNPEFRNLFKDRSITFEFKFQEELQNV